MSLRYQIEWKEKSAVIKTALLNYAAWMICFSLFLLIAFFSTKVFADIGDFATGAETLPQRRKDTLLVVRENLTDVGRIKIPNSQANPLPN